MKAARRGVLPAMLGVIVAAAALPIAAGADDELADGAAGGQLAPEVSDVLRVRCRVGARAEVLTPVVAASLDGVVIEAIDAGPDTDVGVRSLAIPTWLASGSSDAREPFVRALHPGSARVWCVEGPFQGHTPEDEAAFELIDPAGHVVPYALDCAPEAHLYLLPVRTGDRVLLPSMAEAGRGLLDGLRPDDVVEPAGYVAGAGDWPWPLARVVRGGRVVAVIHGGAVSATLYHAKDARVCADAGLSLRQ